MRKRLTQDKVFRVDDLAGGLLRKIDGSRIPPNFLRDAKNVRFQEGVVKARKGNARLASLTRPSGAISFPGTTAAYLEIPKNRTCPLWTGIGPNFTMEWIERPTGIPSPAADVVLFELGNNGASTISLAIKSPSASPFQRNLIVRDASMGAEVTKDMGDVDSSGGAASDRRYYFRVRRNGRDLDTLIVGAAAGPQFNTHSNVFTSSGDLLKAATDSIFVGGKGIDGATKGFQAKFAELRIWNVYLDDTRPYYFSQHPLRETIDLLLSLSCDEGSGTVCYDRSLFENTAEINGSVGRTTEQAHGLMVGQLLAEHTDLNEHHRLVGAGGSIFREVVR